MGIKDMQRTLLNRNTVLVFDLHLSTGLYFKTMKDHFNLQVKELCTPEYQGQHSLKGEGEYLDQDACGILSFNKWAGCRAIIKYRVIPCFCILNVADMGQVRRSSFHCLLWGLMSG